MIETANNHWSTRELERQINSMLYERLALSRDKRKVLELSKKGQLIEKPSDMIKDPYIFEFIGLEQRDYYSENDLESRLINNLKRFLLELGKGFHVSEIAYDNTFVFKLGDQSKQFLSMLKNCELQALVRSS